MSSFRYLYIAVFGFIGAVMRFLLEVALPPASWACGFLGGAPLPLTTLLINLVGCFALPIVYVYVARGTKVDPDIVSGIGVGLVGAFTTLSAFCGEMLGLMQAGYLAATGLYLVSTVAGSLLAAIFGYWLATAALERSRKRTGRTEADGSTASNMRVGGDDDAAA